MNLTLILLLAGPLQLSSADSLTARVDPRVELMSILFRLAGNPEYNMPISKSPYSKAVEAHFGEFGSHPVIRTARKLRARRGVSYDAVMSMAVHLVDTVELAEKVPFDKKPPGLDRRWRLEEARDFLKKARDFVEKTKFNEFFKKHNALYEATANRMTKKLNERAYLDWFDRFFGTRPGAKFYVIVGLLNGGGCYGAGLRDLEGQEEITPIIGAWRFDGEGIPVFTGRIVPTVVHEFCHSYTNPIVDGHADKLEPAARRMFKHCEQTMRRQAYGNWKTLMYESLVRACVVRYMATTDGKAAAAREIRAQHGRGFKWIGELSEVLADYESQRKQYPSLEGFMPRIVRFFEGYADRYDDLVAKAPKVVSMTPPNGATDVDPALAEIKVVFDRPMKDRCWAVVGGGPQFPELTGKTHYDKACKVLTIPVRLKPAWSYRFWLNRGKYDSFQSREGVKLASVAVIFKTREK